VAGTVGDTPGAAPIQPGTLFEVGSNTKSFTAAVILQLAAETRLDLDDRLDRWLPQYPAWGEVTLRRLLHMTNPIPDYAGTPAVLRTVVAAPRRRWSEPKLVAAVYPRPDNRLPVESGFYYSNTNYILAGMIAEKAGGATYPDLVRDRLLEPLGLHETVLLDGLPPPALTAGMASGDVADGECQEFEPPDCKTGIVAPLAGRDIRDADLSWAGAAGATVASPRDLARRFRALHGGRVPAPAQFAEMEHMVPCCA
jgi:D-alanyl-D-alanine carboxypeptidase